METIQSWLTLRVHRGDTLDNFKTCSVQEGNQIFIDRSREPRYQFKETYASRRGIADAFAYALRNAKKLDHTPAVVSGRLPILSRWVLKSLTSGFCVVLPEGVSLPVDRIWLPRADFNWQKLISGRLPEWLHDDKEILNRLELFQPNDLTPKS